MFGNGQMALDVETRTTTEDLTLYLRFQKLIWPRKPLATGFVKTVNIDKIHHFSIKFKNIFFKKMSKPKQ
jgi:hypothetical protein